VTYVEGFAEKRTASINPRRVDQVRMVNDRKYASEFVRDWRARCLPLPELARVMVSAVWSPIAWLKGYRTSEEFVESGWMALDFDSPLYPLSAALDEWDDTVCIIGTTRNHQRPKKVPGGQIITCDRFRIVAPWIEPITDLRTYVHNMETLIAQYDGADIKCKDGARLFFPCRDIVRCNLEGYLQPVLVAPPPRAPRVSPRVYRELGVVRGRTISALKGRFPVHEYNDYCFMVAKDLYDAGYSESEIFDTIVGSPTYNGKVSADLADEITQCIRSGIKSVDEGKAYEQPKGPRVGKTAEESEESGQAAHV
jgi:hypothetical protein